MEDFDKYCISLLEESKRFLEKFLDKSVSTEGKLAFSHSCLLLSVCSLESFINGIVDELLLQKDTFNMIEKAFLLEKKLNLKKGTFEMTDELKMSRLIEKIEILYKKFNPRKNIVHEKWYDNLKFGINLRNQLVHPKASLKITETQLKQLLLSIIDCLDSLFYSIYKIHFPRSNRGLISKMDF
jgi:hypothetical protein